MSTSLYCKLVEEAENNHTQWLDILAKNQNNLSLLEKLTNYLTLKGLGCIPSFSNISFTFYIWFEHIYDFDVISAKVDTELKALDFTVCLNASDSKKYDGDCVSTGLIYAPKEGVYAGLPPIRLYIRTKLDQGGL